MPRESPKAEIKPRAVRWDVVPTRDNLRLDEIFIHRISDVQALKRSFQSQGWDTDVVLQSLSHLGPTATRPIGFPFNFPSLSSLLSRWGSTVVLRLHVDIARYKGNLASWGHIEPDATYEWAKHIEMFLAKNEIRGPITTTIFGQFYHD